MRKAMLTVVMTSSGVSAHPFRNWINALSEIQKAFVPEKKWLRIDPIDNQRGEFEYEDHGLRFSQVEVSQKLISMEDIEK